MATTYNFCDGSVTGGATATQKLLIDPDFQVRRNTIDCSIQTIDAGETDVAQCLAIPARTTVLNAYINVITAETADATVHLGYGSDTDYWGQDLNLDATGNASTVLTATSTWDAASIDDGNEEVKDITVAGAAIGNPVLVTLGVDLVDLVITATVTAEDTVSVVLANNTGGAIDLASATAEVFVLKAPRAASPLYFASADTIDIVASTTNGDVDLDGAKFEVVALCINH
jgi:hypothetical protein